jgi:NADH:ubiquinone oxidoreductase subunit 4 (subunit M)
VPLAIITLVMGIYPDLFLEPMRASVDNLIAQVGAASASELAAR